MQVSRDLPLIPFPEATYSFSMTPELQLVLCLSWAKERLRNSKADGGSRLATIYSAISQHEATSRASVPNLSALNIESAARQFALQAASPIGTRGVTRTFAVLASYASGHVQKPVIIIVWTDKGYAYPTVAYKSGGKIKGLGSHLYVFLPLCGELKMSPKDAERQLTAGIQLDTANVGRPSGFDAYVIAAGGESVATTDGDAVLREYNNELYGSVAAATGGDSGYSALAQNYQYSRLGQFSSPAAARPISPQPLEGRPQDLAVPEDPGYFEVRHRR